MRTTRSTARFASLVGAALICATAWFGPCAYASTNLFKLYFGAAYGRAHLRGTVTPSPIEGSISFGAHRSAYQIIAGARVLELLGVEVDYVDLGTAPAALDFPTFGTVSDMQASQKGAAAFAVLYLPVPVPMIGMYLKAGVARIASRLTGTLTAIGCNPNAPCACPVGLSGPVCVVNYRGPIDTTSTGLAVGAGVQWSLGNWAVRGEYERFSAAGEHPSLVSVGVTWAFL